jgi:hypothetical protein
MNDFPKGSKWRKWDLHVHAPGGKLHDGYRTSDGSDPLDKVCDLIEASDVKAFGITDYFSIGSFGRFSQKFQQRYPDLRKNFFFNLELRLNETVNKELEEVNIHLVFNPSSLNRIDKFLSLLTVVKTDRDEAAIMCSELKTDDDFESATVSSSVD